MGIRCHHFRAREASHALRCDRSYQQLLLRLNGQLEADIQRLMREAVAAQQRLASSVAHALGRPGGESPREAAARLLQRADTAPRVPALPRVPGVTCTGFDRSSTPPQEPEPVPVAQSAATEAALDLQKPATRPPGLILRGESQDMEDLPRPAAAAAPEDRGGVQHTAQVYTRSREREASFGTGPVPPAIPFASWSLQRALLAPWVIHGSRYRCGEST